MPWPASSAQAGEHFDMSQGLPGICAGAEHGAAWCSMVQHGAATLLLDFHGIDMRPRHRSIGSCVHLVCAHSFLLAFPSVRTGHVSVLSHLEDDLI